ncbi:PGPGW domain-containing protein [Planctomicrobium piriforme]|uniref:Putative transmembrane protein (PGPGW) n=1 Tax=Planctomicrobium piriforme TaxID=1576369 RepID=A0A1I3GSZ4_9PLAN|nr:PGPGW domain-containing protein [Planctomicrobium piriforme]SFI26665.1 Putative transmembrane protein (PGPGW) [Planctomicrobium piriforme]
MLQLLEVWSALAVGVALAVSLLGIAGATWMIVAMPADYFLRSSDRPHSRHPALHLLWVVVRNILGIALLALGIAMLVLPGQGLLTMLLGLSLMDFPGKRKLLHRALALKSVQRSLNWIRRKGGQPPLQFPSDSTPA